MALGLSCPLALRCDEKEVNLCLDYIGRYRLGFFFLTVETFPQKDGQGFTRVKIQ